MNFPSIASISSVFGPTHINRTIAMLNSHPRNFPCSPPVPVNTEVLTPGTPTCHSKDPLRASRRKPRKPLPSGSHCASNDAPLPQIRRVPDDLDVDPVAMWWTYIQVLPAEHPRCNVVTSHLCFIRVYKWDNLQALHTLKMGCASKHSYKINGWLIFLWMNAKARNQCCFWDSLMVRCWYSWR